MIVKSFKVCALNLTVDGTDDDMTHCFKEGIQHVKQEQKD